MNVQDMCSGEAALVPGGLRGYRMWDTRGALLTAVSHAVDWTVPEHTATCVRNAPYQVWFSGRPIFESADAPHVVPGEACTCGIYGWYRPDEARLHQGDVFGVVEATGRVLLGDFGFRAERARIVALVSEYEPIQHYWTHRGVPVFEDRKALLAAFPPQDVRELIGHEIPDTPPDDNPWMAASLSFTVNSQQFVTAMRQLGISMTKVADSSVLAAKVVKDALDELPDDPKERALALRKRGARGPVKVRRGRARLSL